MAKLIKLSNTKWKQPFIDRAKEYQLWTIPRDITEYCGIEVGQDRKIHISFDPKLNVPDIEQKFHITTNIWISFPKDIQRIISNIAPNNRSSYFIAEVVDVNVTTPLANEQSLSQFLLQKMEGEEPKRRDVNGLAESQLQISSSAATIEANAALGHEKTDLAKVGAAVEAELQDEDGYNPHDDDIREVVTREIRARTQTLSPTDAIEDLNELPEGVVDPEKTYRLSGSYARDAKVRSYVIARAKGICEYCGEEGFLMSDGKSHYLEAHHIIALADEGRDTIENVIALCPRHHREAHYGVTRVKLEAEMAKILKSE